MASNGIGDLGQFDFMNKGMYPMSQIDRSYYATPTQVPLAAQAAQSDYDPATNPLTGEPVSRFAQGGIATLHYSEGDEVQDPNAPQFEIPKGFTYLNSNVVGQDAETGAGGQRVYQLMDDKGGQLSVNANGNPIDYIPGKSWYEDQYKAHPDAVRQGYRNMDYLAAGPLDKTIDINGQKVDINQNYLGENLVDTKANKLITDPSGNLTPIYHERSRDNAADVMDEAIKYGIMAMAAGTGAGAMGLIGEGAALGSAGGGGFGISAAPGASSTLGSLSSTLAPGATMGTTGATAGTTLGGTFGSLAGAAAPAGISATQAAAGLGLGSVGASGLTAQQLMAANAGLKTLAGAVGGTSSQGGASTSGQSAPAMQMPSQQYIPPTMLAQQKYGELYRPYTYDYGIRRAAQGGLMYANGGGISTLGSYSDGGQLLKGPGDGMSDSIPAHIGGEQPAALANSEFVLPADIVSHLGNGSTDAGAKVLYQMMDRIRMARTGTKKQGKQINPEDYLPQG